MEYYQKAIIDLLEKLSDINFQKLVWVNGNHYDYAFSYAETINLLDDNCFFQYVENGQIKIDDPKMQNILVSFVEEVAGFDEIKSEQSINDTKWLKVVEKAKFLHNFFLNIWQE